MLSNETVKRIPFIRKPLPSGLLRVTLTIDLEPAQWSAGPVSRLLVIAPVSSVAGARLQRRAVGRALDIGFATYKQCTIGTVGALPFHISSAHLRLVDEEWIRPLPRGGYRYRVPRQIIRPTGSWLSKEDKEVRQHFLNFFARIARALDLTLA